MPVIDANIVVSWVKPGVESEVPGGMLARALIESDGLLAPRLMREEVSNALLTGVRRGRWSGEAADRSQRALRLFPIELADDPSDFERAWELARWHDNHSFYDLVYVALAERRRTQFVTDDRKLIKRLASLDFVIAPEDLT